jgi:hypothetical protein
MTVMPSAAVTSTLIWFNPTAIAWSADGDPDVTTVAATATLAPACVAVGVTLTAVTPCVTVTVYDTVPGTNVGDNVPELSDSIVKVASVAVAVARVTVTVYVVVLASWAVTTIVNVFAEPTLTACAAELLPDTTATLFIVMLALPSVVVGLTVMEAIELTTLVVYVTVAARKVGVRVPLLGTRAANDESVLTTAVRVTVTVYVFTEPSQPVDTTEIALPEPTVNAWLDDAEPDVVVDPPTVMVPPASFANGVRVTDGRPLATVAVYVYVSEANELVSVPALTVRPANFASAFSDAVLVTATLYDVVADVPS